MNKKYISLTMLMVLFGFGLSACGTAPEADTEADEMMEENDYMEDEGEMMDDEMMDDKVQDMSGAWALNAEESTLTYTASKIVGNTHTGTVDIKQGSLTADGSGITGGEFVMDMTTITDSENNEMYLKHVRSDDFFGVETYPEARFEITSATLKETTETGAIYEITGDLTIRDKTNEISFEAVMNGDAIILTVDADFTIDRTRWDINFDSGSIVTDLGDKAIKDDIEFKLDLMFEVQQ